MQAKILLFYDSPHLLRSVYCKATHPNLPVTGTVRNAFLFFQLVVPNRQRTNPSGGASIFCDFIASPQQKNGPRAGVAHRPPMAHRLHTAKQQEPNGQKAPTSTPAGSRACISENIPTFSQNTPTFYNFFSSVLFPHARRCAHSASFRFLPSPFTSELKTLNIKHLQ